MQLIRQILYIVCLTINIVVRSHVNLVLYVQAYSSLHK
jgi:hypothetical protein